MLRPEPTLTAPTVEAEPAWEVALLFPAQGAWSEEDYFSLNTNHLVEFSHGRIEVLPMPTDTHQGIIGSLLFIFGDAPRRLGGKLLCAPMPLRIYPGRICEPDLLFLADSNDPRRQNAYWTGADLVIEVVSPDDPQRDLVTKRSEYAQAGIPEYWIVDPQAEIITVLRLEKASYVEHGVFGRGETATSAHYADLQAPVTDVLDAP
jgi:Uma2 family endonuclease